jgi:DNA-binding transcriptional LysR family regulator
VIQWHRDFLKALRDEGDWDAAGRRLGVSTGAVRVSIEALEQQHGKLLQEESGRITLTAVGARFADEPAPKLSAPQGDPSA